MGAIKRGTVNGTEQAKFQQGYLPLVSSSHFWINFLDEF